MAEAAGTESVEVVVGAAGVEATAKVVATAGSAQVAAIGATVAVAAIWESKIVLPAATTVATDPTHRNHPVRSMAT